MEDSTRVPARTPSPLAGFPIGRLFGIRIAVDPSWFIVFALVTFSLFAWFATTHQTVPRAAQWLAALVGSAFFFGSILVHELSHSLVAKAKGIRVSGISLFVFGGVSLMTEEPRTPRDEFLIAIVGPLTSAAIGALMLGIAAVLPGGSLTASAASWISVMNFALAIFNLLPGFPLDGGRVFRAAAWAATRDFTRATRIAARVGTGIALGLITLGIFTAILSGNLVSGLWLVLIGWFLYSAAQKSVASLEVRNALKHLRVHQAMETNCANVTPDATIHDIVEEHLWRTGSRCYLVIDGDAVLRGLLTLQEIRQIPREQWPATRARDVMVPMSRLIVATPNEPLLKALDRMDQRGLNQVPVVEGETLRGVVTRASLLRRLSLHMELES